MLNVSIWISSFVSLVTKKSRVNWEPVAKISVSFRYSEKSAIKNVLIRIYVTFWLAGRKTFSSTARLHESCVHNQCVQ